MVLSKCPQLPASLQAILENMSSDADRSSSVLALVDWLKSSGRRAKIPPVPTTILLSCAIGILGGFGAAVFSLLIEFVTHWTVQPVVEWCQSSRAWLALLWAVPAVGLVFVAWFTRRFAPEAQGHGVPEVITAVGRHDGVIRPRVAIVKILASGL